MSKTRGKRVGKAVGSSPQNDDSDEDSASAPRAASAKAPAHAVEDGWTSDDISDDAAQTSRKSRFVPVGASENESSSSDQEAVRAIRAKRMSLRGGKQRPTTLKDIEFSDEDFDDEMDDFAGESAPPIATDKKFSKTKDPHVAPSPQAELASHSKPSAKVGTDGSDGDSDFHKDNKDAAMLGKGNADHQKPKAVERGNASDSDEDDSSADAKDDLADPQKQNKKHLQSKLGKTAENVATGPSQAKDTSGSKKKAKRDQLRIDADDAAVSLPTISASHKADACQAASNKDSSDELSASVTEEATASVKNRKAAKKKAALLAEATATRKKRKAAKNQAETDLHQSVACVSSSQEAEVHISNDTVLNHAVIEEEAPVESQVHEYASPIKTKGSRNQARLLTKAATSEGGIAGDVTPEAVTGRVKKSSASAGSRIPQNTGTLMTVGATETVELPQSNTSTMSDCHATEVKELSNTMVGSSKCEVASDAPSREARTKSGSKMVAELPKESAVNDTFSREDPLDQESAGKRSQRKRKVKRASGNAEEEDDFDRQAPRDDSADPKFVEAQSAASDGNLCDMVGGSGSVERDVVACDGSPEQKISKKRITRTGHESRRVAQRKERLTREGSPNREQATSPSARPFGSIDDKQERLVPCRRVAALGLHELGKLAGNLADRSSRRLFQGAQAFIWGEFMDNICKAHEMRRRGIITQAEFAVLKSRMFDGINEAP